MAREEGPGAARGVADVRAYLTPRDISVRELQADTSTAELAARALDTTVGTIVKSLLFFADEEPILALVAGDRKLNARQLARELSARAVRLAKPAEVIERTGYAVGGVPPVAHVHASRVLVDRSLLAYPTVYAAAGAGNAVFACSPERLVDLTEGELFDAAG